MRTLSNIKFKGEFRDYQEIVLDHVEQYLKDGKVHIVAAPGSGSGNVKVDTGNLETDNVKAAYFAVDQKKNTRS